MQRGLERARKESVRLCYLVVLQGSRVERPTKKELSHHTAQGPHVYGLGERKSQDNLRSSTRRKGNAEKKRINLEDKYEVEWFKSFRTAGQPIRCLEEQSVEIN